MVWIKIMGKVTANLKIISLKDTLFYKEGYISKDKIRQVNLENVIVDSGATMMCLSKDIIKKLDLDFIKKIKVNTANGIEEKGIYGSIIYEIDGRMARGDVLELNHPKIKALIGQIPLEQLDFLINPSINKLIKNPEHEDELILDMLIISEDYKFEIVS